MQTIVIIVLSSFFIYGWQYCTYDDGESREIAWWFRWFVVKYIPEFFHKPLMNCVVCMASIYGSLIFWLSVFWVGEHVTVYTIARCGFTVMCVAGLNRIIKNISGV